ncbi:hypothetical protein NEOLEDRAFT_1179110 [Neolentinus lepideus HHB14362 ss-1]|uniref:Aspartic peptidase DDI1-type domain-containing protein n=1 Tax=Neolentinus lepideus HHB14362 ss-1 TaxID=1314782 RepID=A0A165S6X0_9AGAM|nr:hypothetical protein NEOLEDRAFT_1179110 [Neolentinus lepideus HHB14362 ss-1]
MKRQPSLSTEPPLLGSPSTSVVSDARLTASSVKSEELAALVGIITKSIGQVLGPALTALTQNTPTTGAAPVAYQLPRTDTCHYCGKLNCSIGKVVLPAGAMVPRYIIGAMMHERIQEWHRQNPNQHVAGILSVQDGMLFKIEHRPSTDRAAYILNADERIKYLYQEIQALDGAHKRPGSQPPGLPEVGEQQPSAMPSEPAVNRSSPSPATSTLRDPPLHPFNRAKDIVRPRQVAPKTICPDPVPEAEAEKREPAYKTQAPVYNPQLTEDVFKRSLTSTCVSLSPEELLAISPNVRSKYREIITPKKVPMPNQVQFSVTIEGIEDEEAPILVLEEQVSPTTAPSDGYVVPDPYDTYLKSLSPEDAPEPLVVAKESHAIRSIIAVVAHVEQVECIIDPGCQIIAMSEAVCHSIGLEYDPWIQLWMQSANRSIDMSLGLAQNVPFQLGDVVLYLQVHVIRDPAYDILLGRPFEVITESLVWNFGNEEQMITICDPNSDAIATIPMFPRGRPKFRPFPYNDH